jgi:hypothetical protein
MVHGRHAPQHSRGRVRLPEVFRGALGPGNTVVLPGQRLSQPEHDGCRINAYRPCSATGGFPDGGTWAATDVDNAVGSRYRCQVSGEARDRAPPGNHGEPGQQSTQPGEARMVGVMVDGGHQPSLQVRAGLSDAQIRALTALAQRVAQHYGAPQDIEWAVDAAGVLWLTQARAITTLYPLPTRSAGGFHVYFCMSLAQGLTRPMTPMGLAAARLFGSCGSELVFGAPVADPLAGPAVFTEAGGRPFVDVAPVLRNRVGRVLVPRMLDVMEARSAVVLRQLYDDPRLTVRSRSWWTFVRRVLAVAVRYRIPLHVAQGLLRPAAERQRVEMVGHQLRTQLTVPGQPDGVRPGAFAQERMGCVGDNRATASMSWPTSSPARRRRPPDHRWPAGPAAGTSTGWSAGSTSTSRCTHVLTTAARER